MDSQPPSDFRNKCLPSVPSALQMTTPGCRGAWLPSGPATHRVSPPPRPGSTGAVNTAGRRNAFRGSSGRLPNPSGGGELRRGLRGPSASLRLEPGSRARPAAVPGGERTPSTASPHPQESAKLRSPRSRPALRSVQLCKRRDLGTQRASEATPLGSPRPASRATSGPIPLRRPLTV